VARSVSPRRTAKSVACGDVVEHEGALGVGMFDAEQLVSLGAD
jgi:hypothetical protein